MRPWTEIDSVSTDEGPMTLFSRGERDFLIKINNCVLMNSSANLTEVALATFTVELLGKSKNAHVLIAGLGMGCTLRAALDGLPQSARVTVCELNPVVVDWCRGPMAAVSDGAVDDPRVTVEITDVAERIARASKGAVEEKFDGIVLDLYEGTHGANRDDNDPFYGTQALRTTRNALSPNGIYSVWTEERDSRFEKRLTSVGFTLQRRRPGKGGPRHTVYVARRA